MWPRPLIVGAVGLLCGVYRWSPAMDSTGRQLQFMAMHSWCYGGGSCEVRQSAGKMPRSKQHEACGLWYCRVPVCTLETAGGPLYGLYGTQSSGVAGQCRVCLGLVCCKVCIVIVTSDCIRDCILATIIQQPCVMNMNQLYQIALECADSGATCSCACLLKSDCQTSCVCLLHLVNIQSTSALI
jgi:hypothetical protein